MRRKWGQEQEKWLNQGPWSLRKLRHLIGEDHHLRDGRVESEMFDVFGDLFNRLMEDPLLLDWGDGVDDRRREVACLVDHQTPDPFEEAGDALYASRTPGLHGFQWSHEHFIESNGVGAEAIDRLIGVHDVAARLRHLLIVLTQHDALVNELPERLGCRDDADIEQDLMPKSGIQKMQYSMLAATNVEVDRHPILFFPRIDDLLIVFRIEKTQIVPAGPGPLRHGISFAPRRLPVLRVCRFEPMFQVGQRALPVSAGGRTASREACN